jgi:hypothetical protein
MPLENMTTAVEGAVMGTVVVVALNDQGNSLSALLPLFHGFQGGEACITKE